MSRKSKKKQVVLEKLQQSLSDVRHELKMLQSSADLLSTEPDCSPVIYRMRLEAFMIYSSSLIDFLYDDRRAWGQADDSRAVDFFGSQDSWHAVRPDPPRLLEKVPGFARKHLDRITYAGSEKRLDWPFKSIADSIERIMSIFLAELPDGVKELLSVEAHTE